MTQTLTPETRPAAGTAPEQASGTEEELQFSLDLPWNLVIWNDPVNLMDYVSYVFQSYFGFSAAKAHTHMLEVHEKGRSILAHGGREQMETHVVAMHRFGLLATVEQAGGSGAHGE